MAEQISKPYELARNGEAFLLILLARLIHRLGNIWLRLLVWSGLWGLRSVLLSLWFVLLGRLALILDLGIGRRGLVIVKQLCPRYALSGVLGIR